MVEAKPMNPANPHFGAEVTGIDVANMTEEARDAFIDAMDRFAVCVIRGITMTDDQHVAFSRWFGEPEPRPNYGHAGVVNRLQHRELFDISNLNHNGELLGENDRRRMFRLANQMWHTDSSYRQGGASYSMLASYIVPSEGADTEFADLRAAYDALPPQRKAQLEGLVAEHSIEYSRSLIGYAFDDQERSQRPPALQYLLQTNRRTGRKALYLASYASHVVGMDPSEGRALLKDLTERATREEFLFRHKWRVGDLLVWDNRCTMHRATPFEGTTEKRDLRRTTLYGDLPDPALCAG